MSVYLKAMKTYKMLSKNIYKNENGIYVSSKNHIQMKIALFWYNFIEKNNLQQDYAFPFEGQKMCYYYES